MSEKQNFRVLNHEKFYKAINPNITTDVMGILYFNSDDTIDDNALPDSLIDRVYNGSAVHSNFINLKKSLIYGSGLYPSLDTNMNLKEFISEENGADHDLNDIYRRLAADFAIFEACALQLIYNEEGKIVQMYHTDVSKIRAEEPDELGRVNMWYYSDHWGLITNKRKRKFTLKSNAIPIPNYNPNTYAEDGYRQLLYIKNYTSGSLSDVYAIPSYFSAINWIDLDYQLSQFHLNKVRNGFFPSAIITMFGSPDDEDKDKFVNQFNRKQGGSMNTGKMLFTWEDSPESAPQFTRMGEDNNDGQFEELNSIVSQKIATAHQGDLSLAGIEGKGADLGGSANKLNVARSAFIQNVIVDYQNIILKGLNKIFKHNKMGEVTVTNEPLRVAMPTPQGDELTRDERRELLYGYEPLSENEEVNIINEGQERSEADISDGEEEMNINSSSSYSGENNDKIKRKAI